MLRDQFFIISGTVMRNIKVFEEIFAKISNHASIDTN